jgi:hypothetical protein
MPRTLSQDPDGSDDTCNVSLAELEPVSFDSVPHPQADDTCNVNLAELEEVPPPLPKPCADLPTPRAWLGVDRMFLSCVAGASLLALGAITMVLAGVHSPKATQAKALVQPVPVAVVEAPTLSPAANTQIAAAEQPVPQEPRKVRRRAAKTHAKSKVATRKTQAQRASLAMR